jgi:pimeloyl-ACP methyl ester carboxylesterase
MEERSSNGIHFTCGNWPLDPARSTLVFIHGSGGSSLLWGAQVEELKDRANTLALDLPGHGKSGGAGMSSVPDYAKAVIDFIDALPVPRPIPCGLSLGGAVTQQLLLDHPGRFAAGILVSTGARLKVLPAILESIRRDYAAFIASVDQYGFSAKTPAAVKLAYLEDARRCPPETAFGDFSACDRFDVMARLSALTMPVLIVSAADDRLTPPKYADFLQKSIAQARRTDIADAGHLAPLEKPDEFNRAVGGFLDACAL